MKKQRSGGDGAGDGRGADEFETLSADEEGWKRGSPRLSGRRT
jgi:hypothetical protein